MHESVSWVSFLQERKFLENLGPLMKEQKTGYIKKSQGFPSTDFNTFCRFSQVTKSIVFFKNKKKVGHWPYVLLFSQMCAEIKVLQSPLYAQTMG